jgi:Fur family iron response transcriptional regulator
VKRDLATLLRSHGIQPSAQRLAVAGYVLDTVDHPSADQVFARVRATSPGLSRATVYNTLNLFVGKGLLRSMTLDGGRVLFDPNVEPHHHFVDEATGAIHDVPWSALEVSRVGGLKGLDVREVQVVLRGRRRPRRLV